MIVDCDYHHMTERESLSYIRRQFGRRISRRTYYNYQVMIIKSGKSSKKYIGTKFDVSLVTRYDMKFFRSKHELTFKH